MTPEYRITKLAFNFPTGRPGFWGGGIGKALKATGSTLLKAAPLVAGAAGFMGGVHGMPSLGMDFMNDIPVPEGQTSVHPAQAKSFAGWTFPALAGGVAAATAGSLAAPAIRGLNRLGMPQPYARPQPQPQQHPMQQSHGYPNMQNHLLMQQLMSYGQPGLRKAASAEDYHAGMGDSKAVFDALHAFGLTSSQTKRIRNILKKSDSAGSRQTNENWYGSKNFRRGVTAAAKRHEGEKMEEHLAPTHVSPEHEASKIAARVTNLLLGKAAGYNDPESRGAGNRSTHTSLRRRLEDHAAEHALMKSMGIGHGSLAASASRIMSGSR